MKIEFSPTGTGKTHNVGIKCLTKISNKRRGVGDNESTFDRIIYASPLKSLNLQFKKELEALAEKDDIEIKILMMKSDEDCIKDNKRYLYEVISYSINRFKEILVNIKLNKKISNKRKYKKNRTINQKINELKESLKELEAVKINPEDMSDDVFGVFQRVLKQNLIYLLEHPESEDDEDNSESNDNLLEIFEDTFSQDDLNDKDEMNSEERYYSDLRVISKVFTNYSIELENYDVIILTHPKLLTYISPRFKPMLSNLLYNEWGIKSLIENSYLIIDEFESLKKVISDGMTEQSSKEAIDKMAEDIRDISVIDGDRIILFTGTDKEKLLNGQYFTRRGVDLLKIYEELVSLNQKAKKLRDKFHFDHRIILGEEMPDNNNIFQAYFLNGSFRSFHSYGNFGSNYIRKGTGLYFDKSGLYPLVYSKKGMDEKKESDYVHFDNVLEECKFVINSFVRLFVDYLINLKGHRKAGLSIGEVLAPLHGSNIRDKIYTYFYSLTQHILRPDSVCVELVGPSKYPSYINAITTKLTKDKIIEPTIYSIKNSPEEYLFFVLCLADEVSLLSATGGIQHLNNFCFDEIFELVEDSRKNWEKSYSEIHNKTYSEYLNYEKISKLKNRLEFLYKTLPNIFSEENYSNSNKEYENCIFSDEYLKTFEVDILPIELKSEDKIGMSIGKKLLSINYSKKIDNSNDTGRTDYERRRFLKIAYSVRKFIEEKHYVGIFFLNYHLKNEKKGWLKYIENVFSDHNVEYVVLDRNNIADINKIIYEATYINNKRVIFFSTYATTAIGTNIRYNKDYLNSFRDFSEETDLIRVKRYESNLVDIDFAYFEKQTRIIDSDSIDELENSIYKKEGKKEIYGLKSSVLLKNMATFGIIDFEDSKNISNKIILSSNMSSLNDLASTYGGKLFYNIFLRSFLQSIGRMSRSTNKLKNTRVVLDSYLVKDIKNSEVPLKYPLSYEQEKILSKIYKYEEEKIIHPDYILLKDSLIKGYHDKCILSQNDYRLHRKNLANNLISNKEYFINRNYNLIEKIESSNKNKAAYNNILNKIKWAEFKKLQKFKEFNNFLKSKDIFIEGGRSGKSFIPVYSDSESPVAVCGYLGEMLFEFFLFKYGVKGNFETLPNEFEKFDYIIGKTAIDVKTFSEMRINSHVRAVTDPGKRIKDTRATEFVDLIVFPPSNPSNKIRRRRNILPPLLAINNNGEYIFNSELIICLKEMEPEFFPSTKDSSNGDQLDLF